MEEMESSVPTLTTYFDNCFVVEHNKQNWWPNAVVNPKWQGRSSLANHGTAEGENEEFGCQP